MNDRTSDTPPTPSEPPAPKDREVQGSGAASVPPSSSAPVPSAHSPVPPLPCDPFDAVRPSAERGTPDSVACLGDAGVLGRVHGRVRVFPAEVTEARVVSRLEVRRLEHVARAFVADLVRAVRMEREWTKQPVNLTSHLDAAIRRVGPELGTGDRIADRCLIERGLRLLASTGHLDDAQSPARDVQVLWYSVTGRRLRADRCGAKDERCANRGDAFFDLIQAEIMAGSRDFDGNLLPHLAPPLPAVSVPASPAPAPATSPKYPEDFR